MIITIDTDKLHEIGFDTNISATREGKLLILVIDTENNLGPSSSGKMNMVATTHGFVSVFGIALNLNAGKKQHNEW